MGPIELRCTTRQLGAGRLASCGNKPADARRSIGLLTPTASIMLAGTHARAETNAGMRTCMAAAGGGQALGVRRVVSEAPVASPGVARWLFYNSTVQK